MQKLNLILMLVFCTLLLNVPLAISQNLAMVIKLNVNGSDEVQQENVFEIFLDNANPSLSAVEERYNILLYIDDRFETEYKNKTLPFSFARNLNGLVKGAHTIRVDLEKEKKDQVEIIDSKKTMVVISHNP